MSEQAYAQEKALPQGSHDQLGYEIGRLQDLIDRMDNTLTPILRPPTPMEAPPETRDAVSSPLRESIHRLEALNTRLIFLIDRVDL